MADGILSWLFGKESPEAKAKREEAERQKAEKQKRDQEMLRSALSKIPKGVATVKKVTQK